MKYLVEPVLRLSNFSAYRTYLSGLASFSVLLCLVPLPVKGSFSISIADKPFHFKSGLPAPSLAKSPVAVTRAPNAVIDPTFNASVTDGGPGYVNESVVQADGKIIAVGLFQRANGTRTNGIARFNPDGSLDASFVMSGSSADRRVNAVALQPDGKIVIGGTSGIARLNPDGSPDSTFNGPVLNNAVQDLLVLPSGKIVVGGQFSISSTRLIRLNSDGTLDTPIAGFNSTVFALAFAPDGKIVAGGTFSLPHPSVARINADGSIDNTFAPTTGGTGYPVYKLAVQPDGKILAAGAFFAFNGIETDGLVRLNENGSVDKAFEIFDDPAIQSFAVRGLALQPDGKILAGFFEDSAIRFADVRRFNADATPDPSFNTNSNNTLTVTDLNLLADGTILTGGYFVTFGDEPRRRFLILNADGSLESTFNPSISTRGIVYAIRRQADGKELIGGDFEYVNGVRRSGAARLNPDGSLDETFTVGEGFIGDVYAFEIQTDEKIIIGGNFYGDERFPASHAARLNPNGSLDVSLNNGTDRILAAFALGLQPDGKILIGGVVTNVVDETIAITRVLSNGSWDPSFMATRVNSSVRALVIQPDNKILFGGTFVLPAVGLARIDGDGDLDEVLFGGNAQVYALKQLPDGSVYAGGNTLTRYNSSGVLDAALNTGTGVNQGIRAIETQPDGKILIGGNFTTYNGAPVGRIARVNFDGSLDTMFDVGSGAASTVLSLALQPDGKILAGGQFMDFDGTEKLGIVRLEASAEPRPTLFDYDGDGKADLSVHRPSDNIWHLLRATAGYTAMAWGVPGDRMTPADYDGDGKTDIAVFRPSNGVWYLYLSESQVFVTYNWGQNGDLPVPGDRDADGKADLVIYRESNNTWYTRFSNGTFDQFQFGEVGDKPMRGDFDGDGKSDIAVFRPSNNNWYIIKSGAGFFIQTWGEAGDIPTTGDFDGDGATDQAVFRPSTGQWYLSRTTQGFASQSWGQAGDVPAAADYDGDGKTDMAVFRPSNGTWYIIQSANGILIQQFGQTGDVPTQAAFIF